MDVWDKESLFYRHYLSISSPAGESVCVTADCRSIMETSLVAY